MTIYETPTSRSLLHVPTTATTSHCHPPTPSISPFFLFSSAKLVGSRALNINQLTRSYERSVACKGSLTGQVSSAGVDTGITNSHVAISYYNRLVRMYHFRTSYFSQVSTYLLWTTLLHATSPLPSPLSHLLISSVHNMHPFHAPSRSILPNPLRYPLPNVTNEGIILLTLEE